MNELRVLETQTSGNAMPAQHEALPTARKPYPRPLFRNRTDEKWWRNFGKLEAIWLVGDDPNVPFDYKGIGRWLRMQLSLEDSGKLFLERKRALDYLGISWVRKMGRKKSIKTVLRQAAALAEQQRQSLPLAQRVSFPRPIMSNDPEVRKWWALFGVLESFWQSGGDPRCPIDEEMKRWVQVQRFYFGQDRLTKKRIEALQHIGVLER